MTPTSAKIERIQDGTVYCVTSDGQAIHLPEQAIHGTPVVGTDLRLIGVVSGTETSGEGALAHAMLNELLGSSS